MQHFKLTLLLQSFFLSIFLTFLANPHYLLAEGTKSIAPSTSDEAALFVGAGNTGTRGGDYGLFAWKDSDSKLHFNIQNNCEKVYMGFSVPKNDRSFADVNPVYGGSGIEENLIFRILDPLGNPINNLSCFGNTTINGEVWQTLNTGTANISSRTTADNGPTQLGNAGGYNGFELDLSACGLTLTGNYSIEFYTTDTSYDPNTERSGFYIPYFDITVADCANNGMTGRVWSNNWGIGIKRDGDGSFDRAFNGTLFVCSTEGFITKIDFNTNTNTRAAAGKNTDQHSGFRAGSFNISFNRQGPDTSGDIIADRQSLPNINSPNPELPVFLNLPDETFCPVQEIGEIKAAADFVTGCPENRCINIAATQPGQFEIIIEGANGNGILDQASERRLIYQITDADKVNNPETVDYIYEACIPWDGKDGNGNALLEVAITVTGSYFQGIYHFPVYDAEFNDDGFIVETVRPALGKQLLYYDDTKITEASGSLESKDGTNGCVGPCHRWTGEWENFANKDDNYGNFNTINTWWFASTSAQDFTSNVGQLSPLSIACPVDFSGCMDQSIDPSITGWATTVPDNLGCDFVLDYTDVILMDNCDQKVIERSWVVYLEELPNERKTCTQTITLNAPILINCPTDVVLGCEDGNIYTWNPPAIDSDCGGTIRQTSGPVSGSIFSVGITTITYEIEGGCGANQTCSFTVTVNESGDLSIICPTVPADVRDCPDQSTDPSVTGTATVITNSNCPTTLDYIDIVTDDGCGGKTIKREWVVYFTNRPSVRKICTQLITTSAPILTNCPSDVVLSCEDGNTYSWNAPTINDGCDGIAIQTSGPPSGSAFPVGTTTITYQIGGGCANQVCSFTVTVTEEGLSVACLDDVFLDCEDGQNGASYSWAPPTASSCCNNCPEPGVDLADFVYMGTLNGHQYYCSKEKANWVTAKANCESQGGHLAVINSAEENELLSSFLNNQSAYIGLSDYRREGLYEWCNGDLLTYTNWYPGQPNNYNNQDVTRLMSNGKWDDLGHHYSLEYILEIPCLTIQQCAGPVSGSVFPVGTTEVAYHIEDNCGNEEVCTFNVTVNPCPDILDYCEITGKNTNYFWIRHVVLGNINNPTGTNNGYGDYTNMSTDIQPGSEQTIILSPGYAQNLYYEVV